MELVVKCDFLRRNHGLKCLGPVRLVGVKLIISPGISQALYTKAISVIFARTGYFLIKLRACKYRIADIGTREGANKRGNSSRLTQSFHFFMFEPIFSPVNALNQPI